MKPETRAIPILERHTGSQNAVASDPRPNFGEHQSLIDDLLS